MGWWFNRPAEPDGHNRRSYRPFPPWRPPGRSFCPSDYAPTNYAHEPGQTTEGAKPDHRTLAVHRRHKPAIHQ